MYKVVFAFHPSALQLCALVSGSIRGDLRRGDEARSRCFFNIGLEACIIMFKLQKPP